MWSERTLDEVKLEIISELLHYGKFAEPRRSAPDEKRVSITDKDSEGWVLLEELKENKKLNQYLDSKLAYQFLNMPFVEGRHRKCSKGALKIKRNNKNAKESAYRVGRSLSAYKQLYAFLSARGKITMLDDCDYQYPPERTGVNDLYFDFYNSLKIPISEHHKKTMSPDMSVTEIASALGSSIASSPRSRNLFILYLTSPPTFKEKIDKMRKYAKEAQIPWNYDTLQLCITFSKLFEKKDMAIMPMRNDADGRILEASANTPVLPNQIGGIEFGDSFYSTASKGDVP